MNSDLPGSLPPMHHFMKGLRHREIFKCLASIPLMIAASGAGTLTAQVVIGGFTSPHIDSARPEMRGLTNARDIARASIQVAHDDAKAAYLHGGRMLRVFYVAALFQTDLFFPFGQTRAKDEPGPREGVLLRALNPNFHLPVYMDTVENRVKILDTLDSEMDQLNLLLPQGKGLSGRDLDTSSLDQYVRGVAAFNGELPRGAHPVSILLCLVQPAPTDLLEMPDSKVLGFFHRYYTFDSLWNKYLRINIALTRMIVKRYATNTTSWEGQPKEPVVSAFELVNEPDYNWIPDEYRIEKSMRPEAEPLGKYVTELHIKEVAEDGSGLFHAYEKTPWGFQEQLGPWITPKPSPIGVLDYFWGPKFDWYVRGVASLIKHLSFAIKSEASAAHREVTTVCGGVTHSNVDYLIRMHRQDPDVFRWIDAIAVHPYHWNHQDVWDTHFVSPERKDNWRQASPRDYAFNYVKRFDFLEEAAKLTQAPDEESGHGMRGKQLWVTEFGLGTKKYSEANREFAPYIKFIKQRGEPPIPGYPSADWEDIWDAFLTQVNSEYLKRNAVRVFLLYALREAGVKDLDLDDRDRSNMAIFHRDFSPRMSRQTAGKFEQFMHSLSSSDSPSGSH